MVRIFFSNLQCILWYSKTTDASFVIRNKIVENMTLFTGQLCWCYQVFCYITRIIKDHRLSSVKIGRFEPKPILTLSARIPTLDVRIWRLETYINVHHPYAIRMACVCHPYAIRIRKASVYFTWGSNAEPFMEIKALYIYCKWKGLTWRHHWDSWQLDWSIRRFKIRI